MVRLDDALEATRPSPPACGGEREKCEYQIQSYVRTIAAASVVLDGFELAQAFPRSINFQAWSKKKEET